MRDNKASVGVFLLIAAPIVAHLFLLNKYAINFPFKDDYRVFVSYLYMFFNSPVKSQLLFLPDNESYPVLMRVITLFQYSLDGRLDFRHILLLCNLFLVLFATSLGLHFYKKKEYWNIAFMCLLVFNTFHHEMYFRTDVGTYQLLSFSFAIFLFYGVSYYNNLSVFTRVLFYIALIITPFGSINGMLAIAMVVAYLLINQENKKALIATSLIFLIQILVILNVRGDGKSLSVFDNLTKYNFELIYAYFLALGGIFAFRLDSAVWIVTASLSTIIFVYTFYKLFFPFKFKLNFEKLLFLFSAASLALIVILRYNYWIEGYVSVLESRYKIYGALIIMLFCVIIGREHKKLRPFIAVFLIGVFVVGMHKGTAMLKLQQVEQITEAYNVHEGAYKESFATPNFLNTERKEYLLNHSIYSFKKSKEVLDNLFTQANRLDNISGSDIQIQSNNPMENVDWGGINFTMNIFTVKGNFPTREFYFVKFNNKDNSSSVLFLQPAPRSIINQLYDKQENVTELSSNFYPDALKESDLSDFEIYGVDSLGL
jgi:hypothetical protein